MVRTLSDSFVSTIIGRFMLCWMASRLKAVLVVGRRPTARSASLQSSVEVFTRGSPALVVYRLPAVRLYLPDDCLLRLTRLRFVIASRELPWREPCPTVGRAPARRLVAGVVAGTCLDRGSTLT